MILGTEVSDNLCSISRLAVVWRVTDFFGSTATIKNKITSIQAKKKRCIFGGKEGGCLSFFFLFVKMKGILKPSVLKGEIS